MPELSVIVVTIKEKEDVLCISEFKDADFDDYELIIRDDKGIAKARNEGVKQAESEKIVFIDDDAEPIDGYLQAASRILEQKSVVAGRVVHPGDGVISKLASHYPNDSESQYTDHVIGCNMGFRQEVFNEVGFFDENFLWGREETEFIERIRKEYPVYYEPKMGVVHPYANGITDYWRKKYRFGPADIYRAQKNGKSKHDILKELLNPMWYFNSDPRTLPVHVVGNICQSISRIRSIHKYNKK